MRLDKHALDNMKTRAGRRAASVCVTPRGDVSPSDTFVCVRGQSAGAGANSMTAAGDDGRLLLPLLPLYALLVQRARQRNFIQLMKLRRSGARETSARPLGDRFARARTATTTAIAKPQRRKWATNQNSTCTICYDCALSRCAAAAVATLAWQQQ